MVLKCLLFMNHHPDPSWVHTHIGTWVLRVCDHMAPLARPQSSLQLLVGGPSKLARRAGLLQWWEGLDKKKIVTVGPTYPIGAVHNCRSGYLDGQSEWIRSTPCRSSCLCQYGCFQAQNTQRQSVCLLPSMPSQAALFYGTFRIHCDHSQCGPHTAGLLTVHMYV